MGIALIAGISIPAMVIGNIYYKSDQEYFAQCWFTICSNLNFCSLFFFLQENFFLILNGLDISVYV